MKVIFSTIILVFSFISCFSQKNNDLFTINENGKWGYIDQTGKVVIEPQFDEAADYSEGLARVKVGVFYGFIDYSGKFVIEPQFTWVKSFSEGLAAEHSGEKWGFIDKTGKLVIPRLFEEVKDFSDGLAPVEVYSKEGLVHPQSGSKFGSLWGYIDKVGNIAIQPQFIQAFPFKNGVARFWRGPFASGDGYGIIDKSGKQIIEPIYDNIETDFNEGLAPFRIGSKWGFINEKGEIVVEAKFDSARKFSEGLGKVALRNKNNILEWGFINRNGEIVVQPQFFDVCDFSESLACVTTFETVKNLEIENYLKGYIDKSGKFIVKGDYEHLGNFKNGIAKVSIRSRKKIKPVAQMDFPPPPLKQYEYDSIYMDKTKKIVWKPENLKCFYKSCF